MKLFSGLRVQVALLVLVVTACLYSLLGALGFLLIANSGHDAIHQRVGTVVATLESELRSGMHAVELTTPDGVSAWIITAASPRISPASGEIMIIRTVHVLGTRVTIEGLASEVPLSRSLHGLYLMTWIAVPIAAVLSALLAGYAASRALKPVAEITRRVGLIGSADITTRVPVSRTDDEIDRLAMTVNLMLDRIASGRIAQQQFTSDAAHELRTPLMALQGEIELAQSHSVTVDNAFLDRTSELASRLGSRVDDLVLLSTLDESPPLNLKRCQILTLVESEAVAMPRSVDVFGDRDCFATVDEALVGRAIRNLLTNACRHAAGVVSATVECEPDSLVIAIDDDGPGIEPVQRDHVLHRFSRLDDARSVDSGGAGLGLSIAASIAAAHRGTLVVTDSPLGGARFVLTLRSGDAQVSSS